MEKRINAILIHNKDNVITAIESLQNGSIARYQKDGAIEEIIVTQEIARFHKVALLDIQETGPVYKYGQLIGEACKKIHRGNHVHDHNITSPKGKS